MKNDLEKILFIPDTHIPYHDLKAWELLLKVGKSFKPDHIIIGGDFIDNYTVSSHDKNPNRALKLEEEVNETKKCLDQVKALKAKSNVFIGGNHEDRLERYLMAKAPELFNFISTDKVLGLDEKGFVYVPYKQTYTIGKLNVTHDTGTAGQYSHYKALDVFQHNVVINHTHRIGYTVQGSAKNERHVGAMFGWLGDVNQVDYMHKIKALRDWSLGFGIGYLEKSTGNIFLVPVPIVNYSVVIEGKLFKV